MVYFNGRGLAELARYVFAAADQEYEDSRFEFADWPAIKPTTPFGKYMTLFIANYLFDQKFVFLGQAPYLEVREGDKVIHIAQSNAIARFLANRFGLAGKSDVEKALADMVVDQLADLQGLFRVANYEPNEEIKKEKMEKFEKEGLPNHFGVLENLLTKLNTEFVAGAEMTYADFDLAIFVERFLEKLGGNLDKYPIIKRISDKVNEHPKIAAWRAKRPVTQF